MVSADLEVGFNSFEIRTDPAVTDPLLSLEGTMNMTGHPPAVGQARRTAPGVYRVERLEFSMVGDWVLSIRADEGTRVGLSDVAVLVK